MRPSCSSWISLSHVVTLLTSKFLCSHLSSLFSRPSLSSLSLLRAICRSITSLRHLSAKKSRTSPERPMLIWSRCLTFLEMVLQMWRAKRATFFWTIAWLKRQRTQRSKRLFWTDCTLPSPRSETISIAQLASPILFSKDSKNKAKPLNSFKMNMEVPVTSTFQ